MSIVAIIVPVRNRKEFTEKLLLQLRSQISTFLVNAPDSIFTVVIDDDSTDGTREMIKNSFPEVYLLEGDGSLWWTGAITKGMEYALSCLNANYFVWLNDDMTILNDFIQNLFAILINPNYQATIVGGIVTNKLYSDWLVYGGSRNRQPINKISDFALSTELDVDVVCGNICVIPKPVVQKIGFPNFVSFPHYFGDYDYISRAKKAGFKIVLSNRLQANTDYDVNDFIRYLPYWLQWYLQPNLHKRWQILKGLTSFKSNQNIWVTVNMNTRNRHSKATLFHRYILCYLNRLIKLLIIDFIPKNYLRERAETYLASRNPPEAILKACLKSS